MKKKIILNFQRLFHSIFIKTNCQRSEIACPAPGKMLNVFLWLHIFFLKLTAIIVPKCMYSKHLNSKFIVSESTLIRKYLISYLLWVMWPCKLKSTISLSDFFSFFCLFLFLFLFLLSYAIFTHS